MKYKDKVSIIIPTYNRAKLIKRSIDSVLNQTYDNIEVIVVDDCSTDNTKEVIKKMKDKRIKYIKLEKNSGACVARNVGIKAANGKYITFNDSDDEYLPEKIEKQYNNLIKNKSDMDFCKLIIDINDKKIIIPSLEREQEIEKNGYLNELVKGNYISTCSMFIKKSIISKYMFDEALPRFQDYDLALRMVSDIKISYTQEILINVYNSGDSISNSNEKLLDAVKIMVNKKYDFLKEQLTVLNNSLISSYSNTINAFYNEIICNLNNHINELKNENAKCQKQLDTIYKEYEKIINSKTWKAHNALNKIIKRK